jgi:hypothetical protein
MKAIRSIQWAMAICVFAGATFANAQSTGSAAPAGIGGKVLVQLTTVDQRDGKVHGKTVRRLCTPAGSFPAHMFIGQHTADSSCQVVQAPAGEGSFFRFSCEGGNVTMSGSVRKQSAQGFTSSYVEAVGAERISRGIVAEVVDSCR